jgi:Ca2+-binding RTX toxin-like protein
MVAALALALPAAAQEGLNGEEDESWLETGPAPVVEIGATVGCKPWKYVVADGGAFLPGAETHRSGSGTAQADFIEGGNGADAVSSLGGNDTVVGGDGPDTLMTEGGADLLFGGNGDDALFAGEGDDTLVAGPGDDVLSAGTGADLFVVGEGQDTILDFDGSQGQRIALPGSAVGGLSCTKDFVEQKVQITAEGVRVDLGAAGSVLLPEPRNLDGSSFVLIAK